MVAPTREWQPHEIAEDLPAAIRSGHLHLYFQPIVSLVDRSTTRLEALPRWHHPEHGLIAPESFILAAGAAGILEELETWAIAEAIHQLSRWNHGVPASLSVTLNISLEHATQPDLADRLERTAAESGAAARRLGFELSNLPLRDRSKDVATALRALVDLGIDLTLDGYAGGRDRDTLDEAPVSTLKVGREVIAGVPDDRERVDLVAQAVSLGHELGLGVIATGIENPGQAAFLREAGCHFGQGFLFSVAMPAEALEDRMSEK